MSSALCRPLWAAKSRTCRSIHLASFPPLTRQIWNLLLHTSTSTPIPPGEVSGLLHPAWLTGVWLPGKIPLPSLPDQLWHAGQAIPHTRRVKSTALSSLWSNPIHTRPTLASGPKLPQCSFICLTLALPGVTPGAGAIVLGAASIVCSILCPALQFSITSLIF